MNIQVEQLSKCYAKVVRTKKADTLSQSILSVFLNLSNKTKEDFWALKDVSFQLGEGEILGVIGRNGAGKSTLLKILSRITAPTSGKAIITGRVSSLLEVGTGFHPELSGRENVYLNGTLLGMNKNEITSKLGQIADFAELNSFLDMPVKQYSSGMKVRLAFSVAAHLQAEILMVDEVLAVGDLEFQKKCLGKMNEVVQHSGKTILLVSHNMSAIKNLCNTALYLKNGSTAMLGSCREVVSEYLNATYSELPSMEAEQIQREAEHNITYAVPTFNLTKLSIKSFDGTLKKDFLSDEEITIETSFEVYRDIKDLQMIISLNDEDHVAILSSELKLSEHGNSLKTGVYHASCKIPGNLLGQNRFYISVAMVNPSIEHLILNRALSINITLSKEDSIYIGKLANAWIRPTLSWDFNPGGVLENNISSSGIKKLA